MTAKYFTVLTNYGTQVFAKALATNQPLRLLSFAVGDGNGQAVIPTADRTALVKETHRANVSAVSLDPRNNKQIIIELTIPEDVGGFYIREMGVFDSTNKLVAYANTPESFKPTLESGSGKVQVLRMILKVSNSQAVTLSIDNSVIFVTRQQLNPKKITSSTTNGFDESGHTHEIEKADTTKAGIVQLSSDNNSDDESKAATPKAIKNIKGLIDAVVRNLTNYIPNSKKSNAINSNSGDTVATSAAVKAAFDRAVTADNNNLFQKIYVSSDTLDLDLTNRQQVINLFGDKYRQNGYLTFANHNNGNSKITGLPLEVRSPIVMTFYMMNGYSIFYCHYVTLNRKFFSVANLNNATYKLNWVEDITNTGEQTINHQLNIKTNGWGKLFFPIENGGVWRLETNPESENDPRLNLAYQMLDKSTRYISFPTLNKSESVAYRSWVDSQIESNFTRSKLTTQNLNDVKGYGVYAQDDNRNATGDRNYPVNYAGTLLVYPSAYSVMQVYIGFNTGETYQRNMNYGLKTWGNWVRTDGLRGVNKYGDTMTGNLSIEGSRSGGFANGLIIKNKAGGQNTSGFIDFFQSDNVPRSSVWFRDAGNNSTQIEFLNTPEGSDWFRDSRETVMTISSAGSLWSKSYGWLHEYFAKQADISNVWNELNNTYRKNRFRHQHYPHHYNGAEVFDIPVADNGVMRAIIMNVSIDGNARVNLPEAFNGSCMVQVTDVGAGRKTVGANIQNGNVVEIHNGGEASFNILAIGWYGW